MFMNIFTNNCSKFSRACVNVHVTEKAIQGETAKKS